MGTSSSTTRTQSDLPSKLKRYRKWPLLGRKLVKRQNAWRWGTFWARNKWGKTSGCANGQSSTPMSSVAHSRCPCPNPRIPSSFLHSIPNIGYSQTSPRKYLSMRSNICFLFHSWARDRFDLTAILQWDWLEYLIFSCWAFPLMRGYLKVVRRFLLIVRFLISFLLLPSLICSAAYWTVSLQLFSTNHSRIPLWIS